MESTLEQKKQVIIIEFYQHEALALANLLSMVLSEYRQNNPDEFNFDKTKSAYEGLERLSGLFFQVS